MKIADFGLARNLKSEDYYRKTTQGRLPVKWMAPEALCDQKYSTSSDVWSFGVLLWEIWTLGETPYPGIDVNRLYQFIREGKRMSRPESCPERVYHLMRQCWAFEPLARPTFADIVIQLDNIMFETPDRDYLELRTSSIDTPPTSEYDYSDSLRTEGKAALFALQTRFQTHSFMNSLFISIQIRLFTTIKTSVWCLTFIHQLIPYIFLTDPWMRPLYKPFFYWNLIFSLFHSQFISIVLYYSLTKLSKIIATQMHIYHNHYYK